MEIIIGAFITCVCAVAGCVMTGMGLRYYYGKNLTTHELVRLINGSAAHIKAESAFPAIRGLSPPE